MTKISYRKINVKPVELNIFEIDDVKELPTFFAVYPTYYNCRILFSPYVVTRMIQWMVKNGYIEVQGELIIKIRNLRSKYNESSKEKNNAAENGTNS